MHKSAKVMELYGQYNITPIFNIGGCPEFNCIETVFAHCKASFKRRRIKALANEQNFDMDKEVDLAFKIVTPDLVMNCFRRSYALLVNA